MHGLSRREFLKAGAAALAAGAVSRAVLGAPAAAGGEEITFGVFADAHYADRQAQGTRHYRDSVAKVADFVRAASEARPAFVISLGDLVDKGDTVQIETGYLNRVEGVYRQFRGACHHVLGNHDVATFTKAQFVAGTDMPGPHHSFDEGPYHGIVLDGCYRQDGVPYAAGNFKWDDSIVPPAEQKWLADDLARTRKNCLVFIHQQLCSETDPHGVKNAPEVRRILEQSGKVVAVFQGHKHAGGYKQISGIHYVTLRAMVEGPGLENTSYALVRVSPAGIHVRGFGKQPSRQMAC